LAAVRGHGNVDAALLTRNGYRVDIISAMVAGWAGPESVVAIVHKRTVAANREIASRLSALVALPLHGSRSENAPTAIAIYDAWVT